ncbi:hypothetical protein DERF_001336 [Dermatophagoides farinae]|uniref:Uncharacterized protein n=1 Tax=Dermatophagoides farinae TaxID=6954 RepID=A0A922I9A5_DERFA|nr:hypothetical protein DERF_001336 [Dermatophagoides farinae]
MVDNQTKLSSSTCKLPDDLFDDDTILDDDLTTVSAVGRSSVDDESDRRRSTNFLYPNVRNCSNNELGSSIFKSLADCDEFFTSLAFTIFVGAILSDLIALDFLCLIT